MTTRKNPKIADREFLEALHRLQRRAEGNRKQLAAELDVHPSTLSRWFNGHTSPSPEDRQVVMGLLKQKEEGSIGRLVQLYSEAPPHLRAALKALLDRESAWDELDCATRDEVCDLILRIHGE